VAIEQKDSDSQIVGVSIIVNGREKKVTDAQVSFDQLVQLAFGHLPEGGNIYYTITFRKGNQAGTVSAGESVPVESGMRFNVVRTDKS
jgi:hypothetical protein